MKKQSLFQVCNALFASSQSIANRTASQWLPPFACLGLTHAPAKPLGLDRKEWLRRTVSWEGCYGVQRAVWRNGGRSPQKVQCELATYCPAGSSVEAATTPSRHHVKCKRGTGCGDNKKWN